MCDRRRPLLVTWPSYLKCSAVHYSPWAGETRDRRLNFGTARYSIQAIYCPGNGATTRQSIGAMRTVQANLFIYKLLVTFLGTNSSMCAPTELAILWAETAAVCAFGVVSAVLEIISCWDRTIRAMRDVQDEYGVKEASAVFGLLMCVSVCVCALRLKWSYFYDSFPMPVFDGAFWNHFFYCFYGAQRPGCAERQTRHKSSAVSSSGSEIFICGCVGLEC